MKKDILAALTFLMTGLLFYVVQTESKLDEYFTSNVECQATGAVIVGESASDSVVEITFDVEATRDS